MAAPSIHLSVCAADCWARLHVCTVTDCFLDWKLSVLLAYRLVFTCFVAERTAGTIQACLLSCAFLFFLHHLAVWLLCLAAGFQAGFCFLSSWLPLYKAHLCMFAYRHRSWNNENIIFHCAVLFPQFSPGFSHRFPSPSHFIHSLHSHVGPKGSALRTWEGIAVEGEEMTWVMEEDTQAPVRENQGWRGGGN